jgi:Transglycosylase SLT domain
MLTSAVCVLGMALTLTSARPQLSEETRNWIAANICAAANDANTDPRLLAAYVLTENRGVDLWSVRPATRGNDHGLFQINSHFQRKREHLSRAHHPYYGAVTAARVLSENLNRFGWNWRAFAAYWSQGQASEGTAGARAYYRRFQRNYQVIVARFENAKRWLTAQTGGLQ